MDSSLQVIDGATGATARRRGVLAVQRISAGVYLVTYGGGAGRSLSSYHIHATPVHAGARVVVVEAGAGETVIVRTFDATGAAADAAFILGATYVGPATASQSAGAPPPAAFQPVDPAATSHFDLYGQSLAAGVNGNPALTLAQPYMNLSMNAANNARQPLVEGAGGGWSDVETQASSIANQMRRMRGEGVVMVDRHAQAGAAIAALSQGTAPYTAGLTDVDDARTLSLANGETFRHRGMVFVQGESDQSGANANYGADLLQLQNDWETDVQTIQGTTDIIPIFLDQVSSVALAQGGTNIALQQLAASRANPTRLFLVQPKYHLDYSGDRQHLVNTAYRLCGEKYGEVLYRHFFLGDVWRPLEPETIVGNGAAIDLTLHVPDPPIRFDTVTVVAKPNQGFELYTPTVQASYLAIQSVQIIDANAGLIRIGLNEAPGPEVRVRYAYSGGVGNVGGRLQADAPSGNVKDSDAADHGPGLAGYASGGDPSNWLVHFDDAISAGASQPPASVATHHASFADGNEGLRVDDQPGLTAGGAATWVWWVRLDAYAHNRFMWEHGGVNGWSHRLWDNGANTELNCYFGGVANTVRTTNNLFRSVGIGAWVGIAVTFAAGVVRIVAARANPNPWVASTTVGGAPPAALPDPATPMYFGAPAGASAFPGDIAYPAFWPGVAATDQQLWEVLRNPVAYAGTGLGAPAVHFPFSAADDPTVAAGIINAGSLGAAANGTGLNMVAGDVAAGAP